MIKLVLLIGAGMIGGWLAAPLYWRLFLIIRPVLDAQINRRLQRSLKGGLISVVDTQLESRIILYNISIRESVERSAFDSKSGHILTRQQGIKRLKDCVS